MRWLLRVSGVLIVLLLLALGVGVLLPGEHTATLRATFDASAATVWPLVTDLDGWPAWHPGVESATRGEDRDGHPLWTLRYGHAELPMWRELEPGASSMRTVIPPENPGWHGTWTYQLEALEGGGCTLTITETGTTSNPLFRVALVFLDQHHSMREFASALAVHLGESPRIETLPGEEEGG